MWSGLGAKPQGPCLIPLTGFVEPAGPRGADCGGKAPNGGRAPRLWIDDERAKTHIR